MKKVVNKNIKIKLILNDEDVDAIQKTRAILEDILAIKEEYLNDDIDEKVTIIDNYHEEIDITTLEYCFDTILKLEDMPNPTILITMEED